ncbi:MAG: hypothetical protein LBL07_18565 [Tannerella sp.]|nr:hypothetical protein [Tannerella sp.]
MKRITLFLFGILCFTACNNEIGPEPRIDTEARQIELRIPDAQVSVYSTATVSECTIDTLWVLVFNGNTKRWVEKIAGNDIVNNGQATQLLPQLSNKLENGNTIICIANVAPNPDTTNITPANINTCFKTRSNTHYSGGDFLPMYGKIDSWAPSGSYTCLMTRSVAKVQVQMGTAPSDVTGNFDAENVTCQIYDFAQSGYVQRPGSTPAGISGTPGLYTSPFDILQKEGATNTNAFIYEYQSSIYSISNTNTNIGIKNFHVMRQHIILTKGTAPNTRYYRLDFYNSVDSIFLDTERNHHYIFTINKVRSEGYTSLTQAQNNPGSNIEYTVRIEDGSQSITSNGQYAVVTSVDTVKLTTDVTDQTVATFRSIDPTGGGLNIDDNSISVEDIQPGGAALTITSPSTSGSIATGNKDLKITTTGNLTQATILFKYGNITHRLYVKKVP